jgi:plasmid stability protein
MGMVRTQIQLTEAQARRLRVRARRDGVSLAEVVRRCLDSGLDSGVPDRAELYARAVRLAGRFRDRKGASDLSKKHNRYLDEAFE